MACEKFDVLIALYVEGDLESQARESVRRHLESCASCEVLRQELMESQQWLKFADLPVLGLEELQQIRQSVHQRLSEPGRLMESVFRVWDLIEAKPILAGLATALVILLAGAALWRFSSAARLGRSTSTEARLQNGEANASKGLDVPAGKRGGEYTETHDDAAGRGRDSDRSRDEARDGVVTPGDDIGPVAGGDKGTKLPVLKRSRSPRKTLLGQSSPDELAVQAGGRDSGIPAGSVIRIEMQTSDPNIRIIWLTPAPEEPADGLDPVTK